ncbi:hypothetical protein MMMIC1C10_04660 [Methanococcus maripaludis]
MPSKLKSSFDVALNIIIGIISISFTVSTSFFNKFTKLYVSKTGFSIKFSDPFIF